MMGGALGLAVLASLAASRTDSLLASGDDALAALNGGYRAAFLVGAMFALAGAVIGGVFLATRRGACARGSGGRRARARGNRTSSRYPRVV